MLKHNTSVTSSERRGLKQGIKRQQSEFSIQSNRISSPENNQGKISEIKKIDHKINCFTFSVTKME